MKTLIILIFSVISLTLFSQSWCDAGANWKYSYVNIGAAGYTEVNYIGDTLIDGQSAQKLDKHLYAYDYIFSQNVDFNLGMEYTYENNGVVYLRYENDWDTLYNFNATIGESWRMAKQPLTNACDSNSILTVTATGTKTINSISLNYLVVDFSYPFGYSDTIIEKIGFTGSYLLPYDACDGALDGNEGGEFRCYQDNNFTTYKPHYSGNCDFVVGIEEDALHSSLYITPNPTLSEINVVGDLSLNSDFIIKDFQGKNWQVNRFENRIDVSNLTNGTYILYVQNSKGLSHHKFVKQ